MGRFFHRHVTDWNWRGLWRFLARNGVSGMVSLTDRSASQGFPTEMNRFTKTDYHNNGPKNCVRRPKIQMFGLANEPLSMGMIRIPCLLAVYKKHIFRHIQTWFANLGSRRRRSRSFQEHCSFTFFAFRVAEF